MLNWVKTSRVATRVNLFGESKLTASTPILPSSNTIYSQGKFLVALDNKVADLETKSGLSTSVSSNYLDRHSHNQVNPSSNPFQIRAIIKAAIDYFSIKPNSKRKNNLKGSSRHSIPLESKTPSTYLPGESPKLNLAPAPEDNSWLTWNDVFSNTITSTIKPRATPTDNKIIQSPNNLETNSDLLETQATTVGYEKHPLVRILEMLDGIIVWVEEKLVKIWRRLR